MNGFIRKVSPRITARIAELEAQLSAMTKERDYGYKLTDALRDALSELRVRVLEVYSGPSPLLDAAWEQSRKALAMESHL